VTIATLLEKAYGSFSTRAFETMLSLLCKDLKAKVRVRGVVNQCWVQVDVIGEDEAAACKLLDREIGLAPISMGNVGKSSVLSGKVVNSTKSRTELHVDIGVFEPTNYYAFIPLWRLQAQLSDGMNLQFQRLAELFCLYDHMPVEIKILEGLNREGGFWEAEFSEAQLSRFSVWLDSNLDRLIVLGASRSEVEKAVERARHFRDVIRIETLGPFEHVIVCKLGTEAVGLIPRLGPYLRIANLVPFSARRIKQLVKRPSL